MTILEHLKTVLAEAKELATNQEVSIGTENLIWNYETDLPIDGYAYANYITNEWNRGMYQSIPWLEELIHDMEKVQEYTS